MSLSPAKAKKCCGSGTRTPIPSSRGMCPTIRRTRNILLITADYRKNRINSTLSQRPSLLCIWLGFCYYVLAMNKNVLSFLAVSLLLFVLFFLFPEFFSSGASYTRSNEMIKDEKLIAPIIPPLDTMAYDKKLEELANNPPPPMPITKIVKDPETGAETTITVEPKPTPPNLWPVNTVYPNAGAILPFKRIIAYYGNLYSTKMGVLGQYPEGEMLAKLDTEVKKWESADPTTPVVPALH